MEDGLPAEEKITVAWLLEHVPLRYWTTLFTVAAALIGVGYTFAISSKPQCSLTEINALRDRKDALAAELADMEARKASLSAQLTSLRVQKEVEGMTNAQVADELKKFARP
ncbi:hypothetical protein [Paraburkholderia strydomiana]